MNVSSQLRVILIADDDRDDQYLYQVALEENKITNPICFFQDGRELMHHLREVVDHKKHLPAFVLLDLNMPRMNGKQVLKALKANEYLSPIPVVVFSTSATQEDIEDCYTLGANSYQIKPNDFTQLKEAIGLTCTFWLNTNTSI